MLFLFFFTPTSSQSDCNLPPLVPPPNPPMTPPGVAVPQPYAFVILIVLSGLSATFSGLNLGLMSLTEDDLNVIIDAASDPKEVKWAKKILPLRKRGNLLLCTLLIGNVLVNVVLTLLTEEIWTWMFSWANATVGYICAMLAPTAIIVIFGEIIPQAYCGRNSLFVGAISTPLVWCFLIALLPITWPIAKVLDKLLGREISNVLSRKMLLELVTLNIESAAHQKQSGLTREDGKLLKGALTFKDRSVGDVMTKLESCFSLPDTATLDHETIMDILAHGHTRVPVYQDGDKAKVTAVLFCKDLLGIGFERQTPLKEVLASFNGDDRDVRVPRSMTLNVAMEHCKRKRTHLLLVCDAWDVGKGADGKPVQGAAADASSTVPYIHNEAPIVGLATMEDFLEELIQDEIVDETDVWHYDRQETRSPGEKLSHAAPVQKVAVQEGHKASDLTAHLRTLAPPGAGPPQASKQASKQWFPLAGPPAPYENPMAA